MGADATCEFGLGMTLANKKMRARIVDLLGECMANEATPAEFKAAAQAWLDGKETLMHQRLLLKH